MDKIKVRFDAGPSVVKKLAYIWKIFADYAEIPFLIVEENEDLKIGDSQDADIVISKIFSDNISQEEYDHRQYFDKEPLIHTESGNPDYLGTCFYMINCLQEYATADGDQIGRFQHSDSFQYKFDCTEDNLVGGYFDQLIETIPQFKDKVRKPLVQSGYFLSHDNDVLYGSFLQDGLYAIKRGRFDIIMRLIFNEILRKPDWQNMSGIMDLEDEYDMKSTFFWLVNRGVYEGVDNADYNIDSKPIRDIIGEIEERGWTNGLHKSTSTESYQEEINKLGFQPTANRNHFLKIELPGNFEQIEAAGIKLDCSLGFAEKIGFRNSYALPFQPYDVKRDQPFDFLEISLHVMDATLYNYEKISPKQGMEKVLDFMDKHRNNAVLSILWHNKYFTNYKYKGYLDTYKAMLDFISQNQMKSVSQEELLQQYLNQT